MIIKKTVNVGKLNFFRFQTNSNMILAWKDFEEVNIFMYILRKANMTIFQLTIFHIQINLFEILWMCVNEGAEQYLVILNVF